MGSYILALLLCASGAAGASLRVERTAGVGARGRALPVNWDGSFGSGEVAMDALLYPDPSAPAEVFAEARLQCVDGPHVMVVGNRVMERMAQDGLGQFGCRFRGPDGQTLEEPGWFYPDANRMCAGRVPDSEQYKGVVGDNALACKVPPAMLERIAGSNVEVTLARPDGGPFSHPIIARRLVDDSNGPSSIAAGPSRQYRLVATNMYKNAGARIANWLEWHIAKGVEHFFLYDNGSDEEDQAHLEPFEKRGLVTRIPWPFCCGGIQNNAGQRGALNHALMKYGQVSEWMISLDQDEFLVSPRSQPSIPHMLAALDSSVPGVGVGHSLLVTRGCDDEGGRADEPGVELGALHTSSRCPPRLSKRKYPGKFFIRPSHARRIGFLYVTPHLEGQKTPDGMAKSLRTKTIVEESVMEQLNLELDRFDIAIAHFRRDAPTSAEDCQRYCEKSSEKTATKQKWLQEEYDAFLRRLGKQ